MLREQFPALDRQLYKRPMVYLDNVATSQTPLCVIEAINEGYIHAKANVHRGVHTLSQEATARQEHARERIRQWINARSTSEIIFTRGTTEAINLVAASFGQRFKPGDEIILTVMEHHANIVPWQLLQNRTGIKIKVVPINPDGSLQLDVYRNLFTNRTRLATFCHISNVLGTVNPVKEMTAYAHSLGVPTLIDGAQATAHLRPDMQDLDADFYAFSLHKMYGPSGIGILYGKEQLLESMPPYQGGGEMIAHVSLTSPTTFAELPYKFEAGTPDFIGIGATTAAIDFLEQAGIDKIHAHEQKLLSEATSRLLNEIPNLEIYGTTPDKAPVISFLIHPHHHYDIGLLLDKQAIEVRTGHHCAQPLMHALGIDGTIRIGFAAYNTSQEIESLIQALKKIQQIIS
ncbi:MAG: cysteine desulfurase [Bacteroides sp.]|nr:cysteine desulfurase [Bacteroides sp.]